MKSKSQKCITALCADEVYEMPINHKLWKRIEVVERLEEWAKFQ